MIKHPSIPRLFAAVVSLATCSIALATEQAAKLEFFESKIRPVLVDQCYKCHSEESGKSKGGLLLDSRAAWTVGGESGPSIIPGSPEESLVIKAISRSGDIPEMPPKSHLSEQEISDFRKWIADGAIDPREGEAPVHEKEMIDIEAGRKFWAFQPRQTFSRKHSIDGFVQPKAFPAPADKLVRRLFLDLIGLPPNPEERKNFLHLYQKQSPEVAVRRVTEQLMARPEFGEKWARHWLDVARYADSNGGDFNMTFPESWRYRNYVIDAFNADMPYDQFLREQIAGDLMPFDSTEQRNRQLIATGYLMVAPKMLTERNKAKMHLDIADEQLDTIGRSVMGLTLGCARCHDHKFDPIPTVDYYALAGILHSTRTANGFLMNNVNVSGWTETDLATDEETQAKTAAHQTRIKQVQEKIDTQKELVKKSPQAGTGIVVDDPEAEKTGPWRKSTYRPNRIGQNYLATDKGNGPYSITWKATLPKPGTYELRVSFGGGSGLAKTAPYVIHHADGETRLIFDQTVNPSIRGIWEPIGQFRFEMTAEVQLTNEDANGFVIADAIQLVHVDDLDKEAQTPAPAIAATPQMKLNKLEAMLKKLTEATPKIPKAMAAKDHENKSLGDLHIRIRGEARNRGQKVHRGFLQVAGKAGSDKAVIPMGESGRVQLAEWLTHPDHPLTSRVMVNRIWQQLFGRGIVASSDNFGVRGMSPSHPELLDYLAEGLIANGWSMKSMIREILLSKTYQQTTETSSESDPDNVLLQHQNRRPVPAETIRDSILAIAGELDRKPRNSVVDQLGMYAIATSGKRHASLGQTGELRQRSIYMPIARGAVPPSLSVFDFPNPDLVTGTRSITTVPAQALFMMNSPFVQDMAKAVSLRAGSPEGRAMEAIIKQLYEEILIRKTDSADLAMARDYISQLMDQDGKTRQEAIASFVQILFSSTEFRFVE
ncbi:DUF1553 domain-containing protein [bacterium]|nr:DUF1553 domain-containing protein [bacterium]